MIPPTRRPVRVPAVRREPTVAETGELLLVPGPDGTPVAIQWARPGQPAVTLAPPYRLDRVDLKSSHRARLHGLTAGIRLVCPDWAPLFLVAPARLPLLACAVAASRRRTGRRADTRDTPAGYAVMSLVVKRDQAAEPNTAT